MPKSVSALYACADVDVRAGIDASINEAVGAVVSHLEAHAGFSRCGKGGRLVSKASGLSIARFDHRTSRAGDPQLHSHLLIANRVRRIGTDGKEGWGTLDGRVLYAEAKTAGMVGQAVLREAMTRRLGVGWSAVSVHGQADIEGVDAGLVSLWSKRHHAVDAAAERLIESKEAVLGRSMTVHERMGIRADAVLATRAAKTPGVEGSDLLGSWKAEAKANGHDPARVVRSVTSTPVLGSPVELDVAMVADAVLGQLVESKASFGVTDIRRAVITVCPVVTGRTGPQVAQLVELATQAVLAHPSMVVVAEGFQAVPSGVSSGDSRVTSVDGGVPRSSHPDSRVDIGGDMVDTGRDMGVSGRTPDATSPGQRRVASASWPEPVVPHLQRFTTSDVLAAELSVLDWAATNTTTTRPNLVPDVAGLDVSQAAAVERVVRSRAAVSVVVGPAGAGKSAAMSRVTGSLTDVAVRGVAVSQAAAAVLAEETGLARCDNLAKWRFEYDTAVKRGEGPGQWGLAPGEIVIVDEASMLSTKDWLWLRDRVTDVGGRVIAVGDPAQLSAVGASGMFAAMINNPTIESIELETVWRFHDPAEGAASLGLRNGDPQAATWYQTQGRIVDTGTRAGTVDAARGLWRDAEQAGVGLVVMAERQSSVSAIAVGIQSDRVQAGLVETPHRFNTGDNGAVGVGVGDVVVTRRNNRAITDQVGGFVANGDRWTVTGFERDRVRRVTGVRLEGDAGRVVVVPSQYVEAGHLDLGYAVTTHKAQGATVERGVMIVDEQTSREALYVGMTRGRNQNTALVVTGDVREEAHAPEVGVTDAVALFKAAAGRRRGGDAAVTVLAENRPSLDPARIRALATPATVKELEVWGQTVSGWGNADIAEQVLDPGVEPDWVTLGHRPLEALEALTLDPDAGPRVDPPSMPAM